VSEIRRQLEDENAMLKRVVADLIVDKAMLQMSCEKNGEVRRATRRKRTWRYRIEIAGANKRWKMDFLSFEEWRCHYRNDRPHSFGNFTPNEFARQTQTAREIV